MENQCIKEIPEDGKQHRKTQEGRQGCRLTSIVGQPLVAPPLEVLAVELSALLGAEVRTAGGAALRLARAGPGAGKWVHHRGVTATGPEAKPCPIAPTPGGAAAPSPPGGFGVPEGGGVPGEGGASSAAPRGVRRVGVWEAGDPLQ